jgi:hypothetical protein
MINNYAEKAIKSVEVTLNSLTIAQDLADIFIKDKYKSSEEIFDYDETNDCYIYKEDIQLEYESIVDNLNDYLINQYSNISVYDKYKRQE